MDEFYSEYSDFWNLDVFPHFGHILFHDIFLFEAPTYMDGLKVYTHGKHKLTS